MIQSVLKSAGVQAALVESEWWTFFWVTAIVTIIVLLVLAIAVKKGAANPAITVRDDHRLHRYIAISGALTIVILIGLLVRSVVTSRALASERVTGDNVTQIEVTAYQWWWSVEYQHPEPEQRVRTANELHVPAGRTVAIKLLATDVIHSFWVPSLAGKLDAIPGHEATLWLRADHPGVYRGQCAEFCGFQHAHMAFVVVVEPPDQFERWIQAQRQTAQQPRSDTEQRGLQLVQRSACVMCHTIRGTAAGGRMGPDLTHFASRSTIGAGTLPRTTEHTLRWLTDPQAIKPGTRMPTLALSADDRAAIVSYLEQLR
jgi:cytochrome c oxidase subunit II